MAAFDGLPPSFGSSGGNLNSGPQINIGVSTATVDVRVVNTNPIKVSIVGGDTSGGQADPTGSKKASSIFENLPSAIGKQFSASGIKAGKGLEGMLGKGGGAAGAAGLAAGFAVTTLEALKSTFIDPLVNAAKGGFQSGVTKGSGGEILYKSFETLGVSIGVYLLPAVLKVSGAAIGMAKAIDDASGFIKGFGEGLGDGAGKIMDKMGLGAFKSKDTDKSQSMLEHGWDFMKGAMPGGFLFDGTDLDSQIKSSLKRNNQQGDNLVARSMQNMLGSSYSTMGITDIRGQAQAAAAQDPIDVENKRKMRDALSQYMATDSQNIATIAARVSS